MPSAEGGGMEIKMKRLGIYVGLVMLSPYLASLVWQILEHLYYYGNLNFNLNYSPMDALEQLMYSKPVQGIAILIIVWGISFIVMVSLPKNDLRSVKGRTIRITDKIRIPKAVGNGEFGTARFEKISDFVKRKTVAVYHAGKPKSGVVVGQYKNRPVAIHDDRHYLLLGATRSGKDRRVLLETIWLQILTGENSLVLDPKGETYAYTSDFAREQGYQVLTYDLRDPDCGSHYNFLQPILDALERRDTSKAISYTWDLVSIMVGEQKGESIWYNGESATIAATILVVCMEAPKEYRNLTNVYYFLAYMVEMDDFGEMYFSKFLERLPDSHPAKTVFAMAKVAHTRTRGSFFSSALGTLKHFTDPKIAEMTSMTDCSFNDMANKKTIIYLIVPDEKKTLYPIASLYMAQLYIMLTEIAIQQGNRVPIDWLIIANEFGQFPRIPDMGSYLSVGAGRGIRFVIVLQDFQQLDAKYEKESETIKNNCMTWIYLKSLSPKTNQEISKQLSTYTVQTYGSNSSITVDQISGNAGGSSQMSSRELLTPGEVGMIDAPYLLVLSSGERPTMMYAPDLSKYQANKDFGLGSKTNNQKILKDKIANRNHREIRDPKLWEIWNDYKEPDDANGFMNDLINQEQRKTQFF